MHPQAMWIVSVFGVWIRQKISSTAAIERFPVCARIDTFEYAAAGHANVNVVFVERIDIDRMQCCAIGWPLLRAAQPRGAVRVEIKSIDAAPGHPVIIRPEQPVRRSSCVPDLRLAGVAA